MSYLSDAHRDWHAVNGAYNTNCPLDCGAISPEQAEAEDAWAAIAYADEEAGEAGRRIRCAHCKDKHADARTVRLCAELHSPAPAPTPEPAVTYAGALGYDGACESGHCDTYNRCHKHRAQDAAASGNWRDRFRSYSD